MGDPVMTQVLAIVAIIFGAGSTIGVVTVALINKFGKGTSDRQTEVALGVSILERQIERADKDRSGWKDIESFLRGELTKADTDKKHLKELLETAETRIKSLEDERDLLLQRQKILAAKFARGEKITLSDITGQPDLDKELEDLEDTYSEGAS